MGKGDLRTLLCTLIIHYWNTWPSSEGVSSCLFHWLVSPIVGGVILQKHASKHAEKHAKHAEHISCLVKSKRKLKRTESLIFAAVA